MHQHLSNAFLTFHKQTPHISKVIFTRLDAMLAKHYHKRGSMFTISINSRTCLLAAGACLLLSSALSAQVSDYETEITRIRKELLQVQQERQQVKDDAEKDKEDFEAYRKRTLQRMRAIRLETDSIQQVIIDHRGVIDSLDALVQNEQARTRRYELLQQSFNTALITACDSIIPFIDMLPPGIVEKPRSALNLLRDELTTESVDNIEATNRLMQIVKDLHEQNSAIQIVQGASPVPEIRGTTYRLRLGPLFEAVVNAKGTQAAVWTANTPEGLAQWSLLNDPVMAQNILKAVNVREGKSLPSLVEIPFMDVAVSKGDQ
jgi:hypothetical protein